MFGHFFTENKATICDDKIVRRCTSWKLIAGTPHTFLQVAARSQIRNPDYAIYFRLIKSIYIRTAKFISLPKQARGSLYSSMIPCPPCVVASSVSLGTRTRQRIYRSDSIIGHAFAIFSITLATHSCSEPDKFYGLQHFWYIVVMTSFARFWRF